MHKRNLPRPIPTAPNPVVPNVPDPAEDHGPKWKGGGKKGEDEPKEE